MWHLERGRGEGEMEPGRGRRWSEKLIWGLNEAFCYESTTVAQRGGVSGEYLLKRNDPKEGVHVWPVDGRALSPSLCSISSGQLALHFLPLAMYHCILVILLLLFCIITVTCSTFSHASQDSSISSRRAIALYFLTKLI